MKSTTMVLMVVSLTIYLIVIQTLIKNNPEKYKNHIIYGLFSSLLVFCAVLIFGILR
jgi:hypothetical protein